MSTMTESELGHQLLRRLRSNESEPCVTFVDRRGHDRVISSVGILRRAAGLAAAIADRFGNGPRPITITEMQGPEALVAVVTCVCAGWAFDVRTVSSIPTAHDGIVLTGPSTSLAPLQFLDEIELTSVPDADPTVFDAMANHTPLLWVAEAVNDVAQIIIRSHMDSESVVASFTGIDSHTGLITSTLAPLLAGSRLVRSDESFFLRNPNRWLHLLAEQGVTHAVLPHEALIRLSIEVGERPAFERLTHVITGQTDSEEHVRALFAKAFGSSAYQSIHIVGWNHP